MMPEARSQDQEEVEEAPCVSGAEPPARPGARVADRCPYRELFAFAPVSYLVTDLEGSIQEANRAAACLLRSTPNAIAGTSLAMWVVPEERRAFRDHVHKVGQAVSLPSAAAQAVSLPSEVGQAVSLPSAAVGHPDSLPSPAVEQAAPQEWETRLQTRGASPFDVALTVAVVPDPHGSPIALAWLLRDITVRKRTERGQAVWNAFLRTLPPAATLEDATAGILQTLGAAMGWHYGVFWIVDAGSRVLRCIDTWHQTSATCESFDAINRRVALSRGHDLPGRVWESGEPVWAVYPLQLPGASPTDSSTQSAQADFVTADRDFNPGCDPGGSDRAAPAGEAGLRGAYGLPIRLGDESLGVIEFFSREVRPPDAEEESMLAALAGQIGQFIKRKQAESETRRAAERLRVFAAQLERSNQELEAFASVVSHDLQEPLRSIQMFSDRIHARWGEALGEGGRDYLRRIENAARRMQALIQGLLALARVTTRSRPFAAVDMGEQAREAVADLQGRIEQSGARVDVGVLPTLQADPLQMRQLLQNLIGNALKFHRPGEIPVVQISSRLLPPDPVHASTGECCQVRIADNGIGFDPRFLCQIFLPFQRLNGRDEYAGTGMGLTLCRKIVERHGGTITAESAPGQGAVFLVTLPVRQTGGDPIPLPAENDRR